MEAPKKPVRPSSVEAFERLTDIILSHKAICKADKVYLEEFREYCSSEEKRLETMIIRAKLKKSFELCQEARNLNRKLPTLKLLLQLMS